MSEKMIQQIANWAMVLTGENRLGTEYYYETKPVKRLEWRLRQGPGQLISLIGLQGTGKTSALLHVVGKLSNEKRKVAFVKWEADWRSKITADRYVTILEIYVKEALVAQIRQCAHAHKKHLGLGRVPMAGDDKDFILEKLFHRVDFRYDLLIGKGNLRRCEEQALFDYLRECEVIFIDLPDYRKTDRRMMAKDLSELQDVWGQIRRFTTETPNIVVAIQKELFGGHFFFGKMMPIELNPLRPDEFLRVFRTQFPQSEELLPDDSIILLGQLSRGVFRRFLKYLHMTLEEFAVSGDNPPILSKHVNNAVTIDIIINDMELELFDTFKDANQRRQAVELLAYLRERGQANQKEIAEFLDVSLMTAARIISKLFRYLDKRRGEGREWIISLKT